MKKTLTKVLALSMVMSTMNFSVKAESTLTADIYADVNHFAIDFSEDISSADISGITLTRGGTKVEFTPSATDADTVTLTGTFERDKDYVLTIPAGFTEGSAEIKKAVTIKTLGENDFNDSSKIISGEASADGIFKGGNWGVVDGKLYALNKFSIQATKDVADYTMSFKYIPYGTSGNEPASRAWDYIYDSTNFNGDASVKKSFTLYNNGNGIHAKHEDGSNNYTKIADAQTTGLYTSTETEGYIAGAKSIGNDYYFQPIDEYKPVTIEKHTKETETAGTFDVSATISMGADSFTSNATITPTVYTSGSSIFRFGWGNVIVIDDFLLTTTVVNDIKNISVNDIYADKDGVYVTLSDELTEISDETKIGIYDARTGAEIKTTKTISGNTVTLTPESNLVIGKYYTVKAEEGFGSAVMILDTSVEQIFRIKKVVDEDFAEDLGIFAGQSANATWQNGALRKQGYLVVNEVKGLANYTMSFDFAPYIPASDKNFRSFFYTEGPSKFVLNAKNDGFRIFVENSNLKYTTATTTKAEGATSYSLTYGTDSVDTGVSESVFGTYVNSVYTDGAYIPFKVKKYGTGAALSLNNKEEVYYDLGKESSTEYYFETQRFLMDNLLITTYEEVDEIPTLKVTDYYADQYGVYVTFSNEIEDLESVSGIELLENGKVVTISDYTVSGNTLTISSNLKKDTTYDLSIPAGFGTDELATDTPYAKQFKVKEIYFENFDGEDASVSTTNAHGWASLKTHIIKNGTDGMLSVLGGYYNPNVPKLGTLEKYTMDFTVGRYLDSSAKSTGSSFHINFMTPSITNGTTNVGYGYGINLSNMSRMKNIDDGKGWVSANASVEYDTQGTGTGEFLDDDGNFYKTGDANDAPELNFDAPEYKYTIAKNKTVANTYVTGKLVDTFDTEATYNKGYFSLYVNSSAAVTIDDVDITTCEEIASEVGIASVSVLSGGSEIENLEGSIKTVSGVAKIRNYSESKKAVIAAVAVYGEYNELLGVIIPSDLTSLDAYDTYELEYSFETEKNIKEIGVMVWNDMENITPYTNGFFFN